MGRRVLSGAVEAPRRRLEQRLDDQRRLAAAGDAGHGREQAEGDLRRDVLEVVAPGADDLQHPALLRLAAFRRHRDLLDTAEIAPGERVRIGDDLGRGTARHDAAAVHAGAGPDIDDIIRETNGVLVVLDHDHGVAEIAQPLEGVEQAGVVALVQADGGLVQHVEHARQPRADLGGEADALALAAGQRAGCARQRQVIEADIDQEGQALADFLEDSAGDLELLRRQQRRQALEPLLGLADRKHARLADMAAGDLHGQRFRLQPVAVAGRAGMVGLIAR